MCVVSMIIDQGANDWPWHRPTVTRPINKPYPYGNGIDFPDRFPPILPSPVPSEHNQQMANLLNDLLKKAAEYDKKTGQPHCPDVEKKNKLLKLANELGVKIEFPDENPEPVEIES